MCEICLSAPCLPRCPNAPEPRAVHICRECGGNICVGDQFLTVKTGYICRECLEEVRLENLLEIFGEKLETEEEW